MPEDMSKALIPPTASFTMFPEALTAPDKENTVPALERKEFIQGVLDRATGQQVVKLAGGEAAEMRRLLEEILFELKTLNKNFASTMTGPVEPS